MDQWGRFDYQLLDHPELSPAAVWTYLHLARYRNNHTGVCFPRVSLLIEQSQLSLRSIRRALAELAQTGLIEITQHPKKRGGYANQYRLP